MKSDKGFALRPDLRKKLEAISKKQAEKEAEENAAQKALRQKIIGVLIKKARLEANKSLKETAQVLDCSSDHLSKYESGEKAPSLPELEMMARFFSVTLMDLLDETRRRDPPPLPSPQRLCSCAIKSSACNYARPATLPTSLKKNWLKRQTVRPATFHNMNGESDPSLCLNLKPWQEF